MTTSTRRWLPARADEPLRRLAAAHVASRARLIRWGRGLLGVLVLSAVALRLPTATSRAPIGYDDGVYLASVLSMRQGGAPFRDVYSSQGPAFLPMLRSGDLLGFEGSWGARLVPVVAAAALVLITHAIVSRIGDPRGALLSAGLVATSGALLFSTARIESDGVAAAFAAGAVLAVAAPGRARTITACVLIGVAIGVKSLMAAPALLAVAVLVGRRCGARWVAVLGAGTAGVVLLLSLPWGLSAVWEQSVLLHLDARSSDLDLGTRLAELRRDLWRVDRLIIVTSALGLTTWMLGRTRPVRVSNRAERDLLLALWVWLAAAGAVLLLHTPLFLQHLTVAVVPAAVLAIRRRPHWLALATAGLLLVAGHGQHAGWRISRPQATPAELEAVAMLRRIDPEDALVITDEPSLGWLAGRASPGFLVDPSLVRIDAEHLTTSDVVAAAHEDGVCAVLFWSGRLDGLPGLRAALRPEYRTEFGDDKVSLLLRDGCRLRPSPP